MCERTLTDSFRTFIATRTLEQYEYRCFSGFTSDVKVWEVVYDKSGTFKEVTRAFELKGHTAGVYHFSFSQGSNRMASVSKDGTWKLWDTDSKLCFPSLIN